MLHALNLGPCGLYFMPHALCLHCVLCVLVLQTCRREPIINKSDRLEQSLKQPFQRAAGS